MEMNMKIRICNANDKLAWVKMNREFMNFEIQESNCWNDTEKTSDEKFSETFEQIMLHPDMITLLIAENDEGDGIGFANLVTILSVWAHGKALILDDIYLRDDYRHRGYGAEFLKYIEDYAQVNGYKRLQFQSEEHNKGAYNFYKNMGYADMDMKFYVKYF